MVSDSNIATLQQGAKRNREGFEKGIVLSDIASGKATGQQPIIDRMAALGYGPKVIRVLLWRLRQQGCIKVSGGLKHRDNIYEILPAGGSYLKKIQQRQAKRLRRQSIVVA